MEEGEGTEMRLSFAYDGGRSDGRADGREDGRADWQADVRAGAGGPDGPSTKQFQGLEPRPPR